MQRTLYFKDKHGNAGRLTEIITRTGEIAQALGVGDTASDLLVAIANDALVLQTNQPLNPNDLDQLTLTQILERAAAALQGTAPELAEELRRKRVAIMALLQ